MVSAWRRRARSGIENSCKPILAAEEALENESLSDRVLAAGSVEEKGSLCSQPGGEGGGPWMRFVQARPGSGAVYQAPLAAACPQPQRHRTCSPAEIPVSFELESPAGPGTVGVHLLPVSGQGLRRSG